MNPPESCTDQPTLKMPEPKLLAKHLLTKELLTTKRLSSALVANQLSAKLYATDQQAVEQKCIATYSRNFFHGAAWICLVSPDARPRFSRNLVLSDRSAGPNISELHSLVRAGGRSVAGPVGQVGRNPPLSDGFPAHKVRASGCGSKDPFSCAE